MNHDIFRLRNGRSVSRMASLPGLLRVMPVLCLACLSAAGASAQTTSGSFVGRIQDPGGNVVPKATVTLRNEATGVTVTQNTTDSGEYNFSYIQPGIYELRVTMPSFQTQVSSHLNLDIQQTLRMDFTLAVGQASETVEVSADTPLIQTDTIYVGNIVDGKQIEQTPLNGRENAYSLLGLAPGVQRPNSNALISGGSFKGGANQTIDGVSNDDVAQARMSDQVPSLEDVAQFNTIGINAPAEYGNGSAQVVILTKSGTNRFHGSAFYFNRNRFFQARNFFTAPGSRIPDFNRHEYGGSVGGPILKDRLFFFTSYENIHSLTTVVRRYSMPPTVWYANLASGGPADFSNYTSVSGKPTIIYDPVTGLPFANNQIPASRISPTALKFLKYYSAPNVASPDGITNNFSYASPTLEVDPRFSVKIDYQATQKDHVMFRFYNNRRNPSPFDEAGTDKFGNYSKLGNIINQFAGNYTRTISNTVVNELVLGLNKRADPRIDQNNGVDPTSLVSGLPGVDPGFGILPTVNIQNLQKIFSTGSSFQHQHTTQVDDNLSWVLGKHAFKFGGQFMSEAESGTTYNTGSFSFTGQYTGRYHTGPLQTQNAVNGFADFLLGDLNGSSTASNNFTYYVLFKSYAAYAKDTWSITPKLTLELGVRYDKLFPFQERRGGIATFNPDYGKLVLVHGTANPVIASKYPGTVIDGSTINYNMSNWLHLQNANFQPRLGFAYRPDTARDMVLRGGFGMYYDNFSLVDLVNNLGNQLPFVLNTNFGTPANNDTPSLAFDNPFPAASATVTANPSGFGVQRDLRTPYNMQYNVSMEGATPQKIALRATYVGNLGRHLHTPFPINQGLPQPLGGPGQPPNGQATVPFQPFAGITYYAYEESTNFNQLQLAARRRFADLTFDAEYQWSKGLGIDGTNEESVTDRTNMRYDYGNLNGYARHAFSFNYSYDLPVGRGKYLLGNVPKWADEAVGGWQLTGVWRAQTGTPFSVAFNSVTNGQPSGRADLIPGVPLYPSRPNYKNWFNAAAFAPVPAGQYRYGTSQRNMMYGPNFSQWDAGIFKNFKFTEGITFQFRAEAFNVLNRANFSNPGANISVPGSLGIVSSTSADNRQLQFAGRISF